MCMYLQLNPELLTEAMNVEWEQTMHVTLIWKLSKWQKLSKLSRGVLGWLWHGTSIYTQWNTTDKATVSNMVSDVPTLL